jgi:LacI family transcriptional regulator, galactose operon repressor
MRDVAGVAGVSVATVSRVINGNDVRDDLAAKVRDAIDVLGYRRDLMAMTLRRSDRLSASIGIIIEDVSNPFFAAVQRGVEEVARERGVITFASSSDDDALRERELADTLSARGVDGLVIAPSGGDQSYLARERDSGVALVFVDRPPRFFDGDCVVSDNLGGARAGAAHLIASGHRRIGFLGDRQAIHTAAERLRGFRQALADHGIAAAPELERLDLATSASAVEATRELLGSPQPPTALFTGQNLITIGAIHALRAMGKENDVALVGFDDIPMGDALQPAVSVVAQEPLTSGRQAAELLFSRVDGYAGPARTVVVPTKLIARGSGELSVNRRSRAAGRPSSP